MSIRFLGSFSIHPEVMRNRYPLSAGVAHYQGYEAILDQHADQIHQLAPDARIAVDAKEPSKGKEKFDEISLTLPLPVHPDTEATPNTALSYRCAYHPGLHPERLFQAFQREVKAFIDKATFFMPQGAHTKKLPSRVTLSPNFLKFWSDIQDQPITSSELVQVKGLFEALRRFEGAFDKLPGSVKFQLNSKYTTERDCWELLRASYPDLPAAFLTSDSDRLDGKEVLLEAKATLKKMVPGFEQFLATNPNVSETQDQYMQWWSLDMTVTDRFNQTSTVPVGVMPVRFYSPNETLLKTYAEHYNYDGFVQDCLKRTQQWIQILKPEGHDAMHLKDV
jgi:hypothetical protein